LVWKEHEATVVEVGGGVREYRVAGTPVLDGYAENEMCPGGAGAVLAPWPNRIREGRYSFAGRSFQLPLTEPERGNAIHGLVRWQSWRAQRLSPQEVELTTEIHPQPCYPFSLTLTTRWLLGPDGLTARHTASNTGGEPCPFGLAVHPYLYVSGETANTLLLRVPATDVIKTDSDGIPIATRPLAGTVRDFRSARRIADTQLDEAFTGLERDTQERAGVEVSGSDGHGARLWMDRSFPYVQIFTGDTLDPSRRRRSVAVEPMTCPANAFHSGESLIVLAPAESWSGTWGITPL
jgi:aldose 1-epimerase